MPRDLIIHAHEEFQQRPVEWTDGLTDNFIAELLFFPLFLIVVVAINICSYFSSLTVTKNATTSFPCFSCY